jgi:hypothetical protein
MEFNSKEFKQNIIAATDFVVTAKWKNKNCRFRIETNVKSSLVKVYVIEKSKIVAVEHFKDGRLFKEEIK